MKQQSFLMQKTLDDVDRLVMSMRACVENTLSVAAQQRFEISVSEAAANIVKHAKTTDPTASVVLEVTETDDDITVALFDPIGADAFDIKEHAKPLSEVDPFSEEGRGLGLILQCTDHVSYGSQDDRMCLSLTFSKSGA